MAVVQSTYNERQPAAVAGMIANMNGSKVDTRIIETAAGIGFGLAVSQGSADKGAVIGGALADFVGLTVRDVTLVHATPDKYAQYDNAGIMSEGDMWVTAGAAVSAGDPVHYNATTGALSNTGGSGPVVGARWMTSAASGELAVVRLSGSLPAA